MNPKYERFIKDGTKAVTCGLGLILLAVFLTVSSDVFPIITLFTVSALVYLIIIRKTLRINYTGLSWDDFIDKMVELAGKAQKWLTSAERPTEKDDLNEQSRQTAFQENNGGLNPFAWERELPDWLKDAMNDPNHPLSSAWYRKRSDRTTQRPDDVDEMLKEWGHHPALRRFPHPRFDERSARLPDSRLDLLDFLVAGELDSAGLREQLEKKHQPLPFKDGVLGDELWLIVIIDFEPDEKNDKK